MDRCEREKRILRLDVTDSTNDVLKKLAAEGAAAGQTVIADAQTAGKGRLGRSFHSAEGGIYLSYLMRPSTAEYLPEATCFAAVAVRRAVEAVSGESSEIKWVNDLLLKGRKICGILTESVFSGNEAAVIVGVGINVNGRNEDLPEDIRDKAGYISDITGKSVSKAELEWAIIDALDKMAEDFTDNKEEYLTEYRKCCPVVGCDVAVMKNGGQKGKAIAINDDFSLKIRYVDGSAEDVSTGEVSVRGIYGYAPE